MRRGEMDRRVRERIDALTGRPKTDSFAEGVYYGILAGIILGAGAALLGWTF
jgi:hypothetical protein